ncbi:T9SS type A sorting domain-containing protein [Antarcticibacterium arcticum]|uniref:T9SS type A sorting domain-containing protein n=1 Tax=Antarcticibacterium arcticum TaxID=2585771 RepID=A0A5B8YR80_9FLAO|nr:T9SS type A sorting domain-containing protein [Antarcticibacterium arcticum]QED39016.1 T9SS type A sorting domain-containing protein [Antarcticibacterium arcticum]
MVDDIAPTALAKNVTIYLDADGNASTTAAAVDNGSSDNCGVASLSLDITAFTCDNVGDNDVVLTVTDVNGKQSTANAVVTVVDDIAPTALAQNVTIYLDADGNASTTAAAVDNGSSDNCGVASFSLDITAFTCDNVGNNDVVLTVTDVNGKQSTANAVVTVVDDIAPTALAQNVTIYLDADGNGSTTAAAVDNGSSDNCGVASLSLDITAFTCDNVGNNDVVLTVTDVNGKQSTANAVVTVVDDTDPVVDAKSSVTVTLDASGAGSLAVADVLNSASADACGIAGEVLSRTSFGCTDVGTFDITLTVKDANNNETVETISVTVVDDTDPVVDAKSSVTVTLDASGAGSLAVADVLNSSSTDACGIASEVLSRTSFGCSDVGTFDITLTVKDANDNETVETISVTVVDDTDPVVDAVSSITVTLDNTGAGSLAVADVLNSASTDACGIASEVLSLTSFGCSDVGTFDITLTVKDANDNETVETISVTVVDDTDPVVDAVSSITVTLDNTGAGSLAVADVLNSASADACGIASEVLSRTSFGCSDVGTFDITLTVKDANDNETVETISLTVVDDTDPVVDAVSSITVTLDNTGAGSLAVADVLNSSSTDACGIASEVLSRTSFGCSDVGTFDITLTVKDANDNETVETISVTVVDDTDPVVDAVSSITVTLDNTGAGSLAVADVLNSASTDACGIASEVLSLTSFGCSDVGTFDITLTVKDANDNETVETISLTVVDDTDPVVDAVSSITVTLDNTGAGSLAVADVLNSASADACGIASEVLSRTSFGCSDVGTFDITLTVKDANDNETVETISLTVVDDTDPVVDAVSSIIVTLDNTGAGSLAVADVLNSASADACGIASEVLSRTSFGCSDVGTFDITLTVTDSNGNKTEKTISVTVVDDTDPVVDAVSSITVTLDNTGAGSLAVADVLNSASADACGIASEVLSRTSFGCSDVGTFDITLTVKDANDNETVETISLTVVDDTDPVVDAVSSIIVTLDNTGAGSLAVADVLNSASADACGIASEVLSRTSFGCSDVGTFDITLTVTDSNGNKTEKTISVTVVDDTDPVVDAVSSITVTLDNTGAGSLAVADVLNSASTDACGIASEVLSRTSFGCSDVGSFDITLTVTDSNGNKTEKTISVTVEDTTAPVVDAVSAITVTLDASGAGSLLVVDVLSSASADACGIAREVLSRTSFGCSDVGTFDITLTVTDSNGNETEKTISVTVINDAPVLSAISGPDGPQQHTSSITLSATVTDVNPDSAHFYFSTDGGDTFGEPIQVLIDDDGKISYTFTPSEAEVYLVKLEVVDVCGLTATEEFRYVVIFDPNGGFVTGGGTIWSPAGAYKDDMLLEGPANFGFNAKYKNGKNLTNEVDGSTNFQFKAGNFHFKSSSHQKESLIVSGGFKATYKGVGTVNGQGNYQFLVTVIDAEETSNHSTDLFRIKIWDGNRVVYDNNLGNTEDNADPSTAITGGSIVIHKPKGNNKTAETSEKPTLAVSEEALVVEILESMAVAPNPVRTDAKVRFSLLEDAAVVLRVYDFNGREVDRLFSGNVKASQQYEVEFLRKNLMSGVYILKLSTDRGNSYDKQIIIE